MKMSPILAIAVVGTTVLVIAAIVLVLWRERTSARTSAVAVVSGIVLAVWAAAMMILSSRGVFIPPEGQSAPPVGINLVIVFMGLAFFLTTFSSLRGLLTNQKHLILLNLWRLLGIVFLTLMWKGQVPALWALPAGIGDIIVGVLAPWIASGLDRPGGRRRAILFNLFGMADLVVAVGLGIMTSPGLTQVFHTTPTAEVLTRFPMALVPTFLVPLAFTLHVVSLWQLLGTAWTSPRFVVPAEGR